MIVADTSGLIALYDADDAAHDAVAGVVEKARSGLIVSSAILAEVDYLLRKFLGARAGHAFLADLRSAALTLDEFTAADLPRCQAYAERYRDLEIGLADAAVLATAERLGTREILTFDHRHFRAIRDVAGAPFVLLPGDAPY